MVYERWERECLMGSELGRRCLYNMKYRQHVFVGNYGTTKKMPSNITTFSGFFQGWIGEHFCVKLILVCPFWSSDLHNGFFALTTIYLMLFMQLWPSCTNFTTALFECVSSSNSRYFIQCRLVASDSEQEWLILPTLFFSHSVSTIRKGTHRRPPTW